MPDFRSFGILPAAGHSRRMGQPKLLLPFNGKPIIHHLIDAWIESQISNVFLVVRKDDHELQAACDVGSNRVCVVVPDQDPVDMKASVTCAIEQIRKQEAPLDQDVWLLAPADMPNLNSEIIDCVLREHTPSNPQVVVPEVNGRRGHPVLFPWHVSNELSKIPADQGINSLLDQHPRRAVQIEQAPSIFDDVDTPEDYRRLTK